MNAFERRLQRRFDEVDLPAITPGVVVDVHLRGRRIANLRVGRTWERYDLASVTKIIFGASASLQYFTENRAALNRPVHEVLDWWRPRTTPADLLSHVAGLEWWLPMFKKLKGPLTPEARWAQMLKLLREVKPRRRATAVYSDIDLWMLGAYFLTVREKSMHEIWLETADRLDLRDLEFHLGNKPPRARTKYAPTEDCPWRGRVLQGEVHDENTWALAGVAMNAGLFGTAEAVSDWGLELRRGFLGESSGFGDPKLVRQFTGRRLPRARGDWGLGFMKPSRPRASAGRHFSAKSFGHTGFTGTSLWYDPVRDLLVVILSNRVHPTRDNQSFVKLRPAIHDWICEELL